MSEGNGLATRDVLLAKGKRRFRIVELTEFDLPPVRLRNLDEHEKSTYETETLLPDRKGQLRAKAIERARRKLIALTVVDVKGNLEFVNADLAEMEKMDGAVTTKIYSAAQEHCGFSENDIEDLAKNSEATPADSSPAD